MTDRKIHGRPVLRAPIALAVVTADHDRDIAGRMCAAFG